MPDALTTHMESMARIISDMRRLQSCPDRIDMAYRLGKLSDQLEKECHDYLMALTMEILMKKAGIKNV